MRGKALKRKRTFSAGMILCCDWSQKLRLQEGGSDFRWVCCICAGTLKRLDPVIACGPSMRPKVSCGQNDHVAVESLLSRQFSI